MQAKCTEREANNVVNIGIITLNLLVSLSAKAHNTFIIQLHLNNQYQGHLSTPPRVGFGHRLCKSCQSIKQIARL